MPFPAFSVSTAARLLVPDTGTYRILQQNDPINTKHTAEQR